MKPKNPDREGRLLMKRSIAPVLVVIAAAMRGAGAEAVWAQATGEDMPNPYQTTDGYLRMPIGRSWGSVSAVDIDPDGLSVWIAERCGSDSMNGRYAPRSCGDNDVPPVLKFNPDGILVRSFGRGLFAMPHGIHVDAQGNIWVTDAPFTQAGGASGRGHHVTKFSPEGDILLRLGVPGESGNDERHFNMPSDVITAPNGDIFVADGHGQGTNARIVKFSPDGTFITAWGEFGSDPGQFGEPHGLAMDSQGRLFVADRANSRIQIFDQEGTFLEEWYQFGHLSGIHIDQDDVLYGVDSESDVASGRKRGIRVGSVRTGEVWAFIPDPADPNGRHRSGSGGEGIVADVNGVIYSAEVGPRGVKRYHRYIDP